VDARDAGAGTLIVARTDARSALGLEEALADAGIRRLGADILFLEAPRDAAEMRRFCTEVPGIKMANMLEEGITPILPPTELAEIGYGIAAYPLTLLSAAVFAMREALAELAAGRTPKRRVDFRTLRELVGFDAYDDLLKRY
jgi:2-methylisocitrate lyase-like PEP mutase family enzyme